MFSFVYSKFIYPKCHNVYMSIDLLCMLCDIFYACYYTLFVKVKPYRAYVIIMINVFHAK